MRARTSLSMAAYTKQHTNRHRVPQGMRYVALAGVAWAFGAPTAAQPRSDDAPKTRVELVARSTAAVPGEPLELGLHFDIDDGWHTYMPSQNDTGLPATAAWSVEVDGRPRTDLAPGDLRWPVGHRYVLPGAILDHVYEGSATATTILSLPDGLDGERLRIVADLEWLVCDAEQCLPEFGEVSIELPIAATDAPSEHESLFAEAHAGLGALFVGDRTGPIAISITSDHATITSDVDGQLTFLPDESSVFIDDLLGSGVSESGSLTLRFERDDQKANTPDAGERLTGWIRFEPAMADGDGNAAMLLRLDRPLPPIGGRDGSKEDLG